MGLQESRLNIWWVLGHILYFLAVKMGGFPTMCLEIQPLPLVALDVVVELCNIVLVNKIKTWTFPLSTPSLNLSADSGEKIGILDNWQIHLPPPHS